MGDRERQDPPLDETLAIADDEIEDLTGTMAMGLDEALAAKHKPATPFPRGASEAIPRSQPGIPGAPWSPESDPVEPPDSAFEGTQRLKRVELDQTVALDASTARSPAPAPEEVAPVAPPPVAPPSEAVTPDAARHVSVPAWREEPRQELDRGAAGPVRPPRPHIAEQRVDLSGLYSRFKRS